MFNLTTPHKTCTKCGETKPATTEYFYRKSATRDGLTSFCKECINAQQAEYKAANPDKVKASKKAEYEKHKDKYIKRAAESQKVNKDKLNEKARKRWAENRTEINKRKRNRYEERGEDAKGVQRKWKAENKEKVKANSKRYSEKNKDKISDRLRKWREKNPDQVRKQGHINVQRRSARKQNLPDAFTQSDWENALAYFDNRCAICGRQAGLFHTLAADHWIPLSSPDCIGTTPKNIVPLCHGLGGCNNAKKDKDALTWLIEKYGEKKGKALAKKIQAYFDSLI